MCVDLWLSNPVVREHPQSDRPPWSRARTTSRKRWLGPGTVKPEEAHSCSDPWCSFCTFSEGCQDSHSWEVLRGDDVAFGSHWCLGPCSVLLDGASHCRVTLSPSPGVKWLPATTPEVTGNGHGHNCRANK